MSEPQAVAVIQKNAMEEVRVALTDFNGHALVDIRVYAESSTSGGERRPTKKGISLNRTKLRELIAALQTAERDGA